MAYRAGVVGASGYTGAELLRLLAGHPEIEVVHATAALATRARPWASCIPACSRPTSGCASRRSTPPTSPGSTSCSARCRTARARRCCRACSTTSATRSTSAPTSGCRPTCTRAGTARRTTRPTPPTAFAYGLVELYRDEIATHAHVASPGCYPTAVSLACAPLVALELVEPRIVADAVSGVSGAGRGLKTTSLFSEANENVERVRPAHAPPHRGDGAGAHEGRGATGAGVVHAAPRADDARHPRHVLRAPGHRRAVDRAPARALPRLLRRRSVRRRGRRAVGHEGDLRRQRRARHRAVRRAHRDRRRDRGRGQPREGRVGPDDPGRQPAPRPARDHRPCRCSGISREHHRTRKGFVAGGLACGIKESGAPDLALVATDDHAPVPAAAVFTSNLAQAAPVQVSRAHLADGRAAAVVLSSGNANAATGEAGRRDARRMCELAGEGIDVATADVLVCSTGLIGIPMPMAALEAGIPKVCGALQRRRRARRRAGDAHDRHRAQGSGRVARATRSSAGWPRARRCCRPRWPRCSRCSPPTRRSTRRAAARAGAAPCATRSTASASTAAAPPTTP